jgi:hypothetical protein
MDENETHINEIYHVLETDWKGEQDHLDEVPNLNEIDNMDEMETSYMWV